MSYLNNQVGYREDLLTTRSVIKKDNYVILEPDGLVKNAIPGYENCDVTILGSPAMGASFADYLVTARDGGKNDGIGGEGLETFLYVISGEVTVKNADKEEVLTEADTSSLLRATRFLSQTTAEKKQNCMFTSADMRESKDTAHIR